MTENILTGYEVTRTMPNGDVRRWWFVSEPEANAFVVRTAETVRVSMRRAGRHLAEPRLTLPCRYRKDPERSPDNREGGDDRGLHHLR